MEGSQTVTPSSSRVRRPSPRKEVSNAWPLQITCKHTTFADKCFRQRSIAFENETRQTRVLDGHNRAASEFRENNPVNSIPAKRKNVNAELPSERKLTVISDSSEDEDYDVNTGEEQEDDVIQLGDSAVKDRRIEQAKQLARNIDSSPVGKSSNYDCLGSPLLRRYLLGQAGSPRARFMSTINLIPSPWD